MNDDAFYSADGTPVIPMVLLFTGLPMFAVRAVFNGRILTFEWWDLHWRLFLASRLRDRRGRIVWRRTWETPQ